MKITFTNENGAEMEIPARYEVCWNCEGKGTQVNPAIDGNGLPEDFYNDSDFMEDYFSGTYDIHCVECKGERVILEADEDRSNPAVLAEYLDYLDRRYAYEVEREYERRWLS